MKALGAALLLSLTLSWTLARAATDQQAAGHSIVDLNTPRTFPSISSAKEWQARATEIRQQVLVSCGLWPMPEKKPVDAQIFGKVERDGYSIEKVYFETWPGLNLAGNLYRPLGRGKGPFPAILNPHGHWAMDGWPIIRTAVLRDVALTSRGKASSLFPMI